MGEAAKGRTKSALSGLLLALVSTAISLCLAEVTLRVAGYHPWRYVVHENEVTTNERSAVLGWRSKAGRYIIPPYSPAASEIRMTYLDHGLRQTHMKQDNHRDERPKMVVVGGSYTQGWAISDHETLPWKLQQAFPAYEVLNYGTGGYGTYQSLLTLEKNLPLLKATQVIIYGFLDIHERRNVAPASWLDGLSRNLTRNHVYLPYATIESGNKLVRQQPDKWAEFPLREQLVLATMIEKAYMKLKTMRRDGQRRAVTEKLLLEMQRLSADHNAKLVILMLRAEDEPRSHYNSFFQAHGITAIDCVYALTADLQVIGEGHPNGIMTSKWMSCIEASGKLAGPAFKTAYR